MDETLPEQTDAEFELQRDVGWLIYDVSRRFVRAMERRVKQVGITPQQWRVLVEIASEDGQTQTQISEETEIAPAPLGRLLDRLEEQHIIDRKPDPHDRRVRRIYLVGGEQGPFFERIRQLARQQFDIAYNSISEAEQKQLQALLGKMNSNMLESELSRQNPGHPANLTANHR